MKTNVPNQKADNIITREPIKNTFHSALTASRTTASRTPPTNRHDTLPFKQVYDKVQFVSLAFFIIVLLFVTIPDVNALGISPGKKVIDFEPRLRTEVLVSVINPDHREFTAVILARGELAKYIELPEQSITFQEGEGEKIISYELLLPANLEEPGNHEAEIVVREVPKDTEGEIQVGALIAVVHKAVVRVPYPGKYAEAEFEVVSGNQGEVVKFLVRTVNLGSEHIEKAQATIFVYDTNNEVVDVIHTDTKEIKQRQRKELVATWNKNVSLGTYRATAILDYDGVIDTYENNFVIGNFFIKPLAINVKNFELGDVAKFDTLVENLAHEPVNDLTAEIILFDEASEVMADVKSSPTDIAAKEKKEVQVFWVTENVAPGTYLGKLILTYADKALERKLRLDVETDAIEVEIVGVTAFAVREPETGQPTEIGISSTAIIIALLVISNIGLVLYFTVFRKRKSKIK